MTETKTAKCASCDNRIVKAAMKKRGRRWFCNSCFLEDEKRYGPISPATKKASLRARCFKCRKRFDRTTLERRGQGFVCEDCIAKLKEEHRCRTKERN